MKAYHRLTYLYATLGAKLGCLPCLDFNKTEELSAKAIHALHAKKVLLRGWYFRDYAALIRQKADLMQLFAFKENLRRRVDACLPERKAGVLRLGLHLRLARPGDRPDGKYLFNEETYLRAAGSFLRKRKAKDKGVQLLLVGEGDLPEAEKVKTSLGASVEVYYPKGNPGEILYALSTCSYIMGPPSVFSLMAAFYEESLLYWMYKAQATPTERDFHPFEYWFRRMN